MNKIEKRLAERKTTVEQELQALIVKCNMLKRQRDEARRRNCELLHEGYGRSPEEWAERKGWDCFKKD